MAVWRWCEFISRPRDTINGYSQMCCLNTVVDSIEVRSLVRTTRMPSFPCSLFLTPLLAAVLVRSSVRTTCIGLKVLHYLKMRTFRSQAHCKPTEIILGKKFPHLLGFPRHTHTGPETAIQTNRKTARIRSTLQKIRNSSSVLLHVSHFHETTDGFSGFAWECGRIFCS